MIMDTGYLIIAGVAALISAFVRNRMMATMKKLSQIGLSSGLSGQEVAERMLGDFNIHDVRITSTRGTLTDHYNPLNKSVNLSEWVYSPASIAAAAVSAHEVGHAVQHATSHPLLKFRSAIVPVLKFASPVAPYVIMAGLGLGMLQLAWAGVALFGISTLFAVITLPVEFDASKRALAWLEEKGITRGEETALAKKGLFWAAMTYVVAALTSLAYLLYFVSLIQGRD
ncbi:MAG: zinc metallopeptidase [Bacteroidota bacterium]